MAHIRRGRKGHKAIWFAILALAAVIFFEFERQVALELAVAKLQSRVQTAEALNSALSHVIDVKVSGLNAQINDVRAAVDNLTVGSAHMGMGGGSAPIVNVKPKVVPPTNDIFGAIRAWLDGSVKPLVPPEFVVP